MAKTKSLKELSIIITHCNTPELLNLCLDSIQKTTENIKKELIVVDSQTKEETESLLKERYPKVKFISFKDNVGYSKIVNAGLKKIKGDYVLILNADIIVFENAVSELLNYMRRHADVGIASPQLLDFTNNIQNSCFSKPNLKIILARRTFFGKLKYGKKCLKRFVISDWDRKTTREVDWVQGSALMVNKKALKEVGLLDERFFMYFEDADWCRRFWQNGYKVIYFPNAKMAHYYHRSSKKRGAILDIFLNKYTRAHIVSALKYFWKYKKINESKRN